MHHGSIIRQQTADSRQQTADSIIILKVNKEIYKNTCQKVRLFYLQYQQIG